MATISKKVYCYSIKSQNNLSDTLDTYMKKVNNNYKNLEKRKLIFTDQKDNMKYFLDVRRKINLKQDPNNKNESKNKISHMYECILYKLRDSDFPYLFNLTTGAKNKIIAQKADTLMEQTHFLIFPQIGLIISEYNHVGARISKFINTIQNSLEIKYSAGLQIKFIYDTKTIEKIRNLKTIKSITLKAGHQGFKTLSRKLKIGPLDTILGTFENESELEFEIIIKGKGKNKGVIVDEKNPKSTIKNRLEDLYKYITKNKDSADIKKVQINELDKGSKLPIDLFEEYLVSDISVIKLDNRFKYVDQEDMFKNLFLVYNDNKFELGFYEKMLIPNEYIAEKNEDISATS